MLKMTLQKEVMLPLIGAFSCMLVKTLTAKKQKVSTKTYIESIESAYTDAIVSTNLPMEPAKFINEVKKLSSPVLLFCSNNN